MGQTVGSLMGYSHEHRTTPDGASESLITLVNKTILKRTIRLQFTIVHAKDDEEELRRDDLVQVSVDEDMAQQAGVAQQEEEEAEAEAIQASAILQALEQEAELNLPPLAFVDDEEEEENNKEDNINTNEARHTKRKPREIRRALSTGATEVPSPSIAAADLQQRRPRAHSIGGTAPSAGRLSVQSVSDVVSIMGADGQARMMNRVRLSMHDQEEVILIPVGGRGGGSDEVDGATASEPQARRCQSVTVSLETAAELQASGNVSKKEEKAEEEEKELNLEIEEVEGFRPLGHMTHAAAAAVTTVRTNAELEAAVLRLCNAYSKDEASHTVISNKRDIKVGSLSLHCVIHPPIPTYPLHPKKNTDHHRLPLPHDSAQDRGGIHVARGHAGLEPPAHARPPLSSVVEKSHHRKVLLVRGGGGRRGLLPRHGG